MKKDFQKRRLGEQKIKNLGWGIVCLFFFCYGYLVHRNRLFPYGLIQTVYKKTPFHRPFPEGSWHRAALEEKADDEAMAGLPYLPGYRPHDGRGGVVLYDEEKAFPGLNLYCSGHAPEAVLMDMNGRTVHTWLLDEIPEPHRPSQETRFLFPEWGFWRKVHVFGNGDLLAIYENAGLVRMDRGSRVLWTFWGGCHHDLFVEDSGNILVLGKQERKVASLDRKEAVWDELIYVLDGETGEHKDELSILDCFLESRYAALLDKAPPGPDIIHNNTVHLIESGRGEPVFPFLPGNIIVSARTLDTVAVIDPVRKRVVWALTGLWRGQHEPVLLDNGQLLVFNNRLKTNMSEILELDPVSQQVRWSYRAEGFYSRIFGSQQRLPNGNTLITESTDGRAFEVTREGMVVWRFQNPQRAGPNKELIATLFEITRVPYSYFDEDSLFKPDP